MDDIELKETLKDHENRLRGLESSNIKLGDKLSNLCDKLDSLINLLKWVGVTFTGGFLSILLFIIEQHIK